MKWIALLLILSSYGCLSGLQLLRQVDAGMSIEEIEVIMGRRDGFSTVQRDGHEYTLFQYINKLCDPTVNNRDYCDFYIILKDGYVIETGAKNVRSSSPNMQFLYIFQP